jgi:hypothetical protein
LQQFKQVHKTDEVLRQQLCQVLDSHGLPATNTSLLGDITSSLCKAMNSRGLPPSTNTLLGMLNDFRTLYTTDLKESVKEMTATAESLPDAINTALADTLTSHGLPRSETTLLKSFDSLIAPHVTKLQETAVPFTKQLSRVSKSVDLIPRRLTHALDARGLPLTKQSLRSAIRSSFQLQRKASKDDVGTMKSYLGKCVLAANSFSSTLLNGIGEALDTRGLPILIICDPESPTSGGTFGDDTQRQDHANTTITTLSFPVALNLVLARMSTLSSSIPPLVEAVNHREEWQKLTSC